MAVVEAASRDGKPTVFAAADNLEERLFPSCDGASEDCKVEEIPEMLDCWEAEADVADLKSLVWRDDVEMRAASLARSLLVLPPGLLLSFVPCGDDGDVEGYA